MVTPIEPAMHAILTALLGNATHHAFSLFGLLPLTHNVF